MFVMAKQNYQNNNKKNTAVEQLWLKRFFHSWKKTAKEKTPIENTAGDPTREQLVLPVFWQKSQLQEVFCS